MDSLYPYLKDVADWVLVTSIESSLLILLILIFRRVFRKILSPGAKYLLWLPLLVSLLLPVGFKTHWLSEQLANSGVPVFVETSQTFNPVQTKQNSGPATHILIKETADQRVSTKVATSPERSTASSVPGASVLPAIWLFGSLAVLILLGITQYRFSRLIGKAGTGSENLRDACRQCQTELGLRTKVAILESAALNSPFAAGLFRPRLVMPAGIDSRVGADALKHILLHELIHIRRGDILVNWVASLALLLHWFNPLVWFAVRRLKADQEQSCDAAVLNYLGGQNREAYGNTLIMMSDRFPVQPVMSTTLLQPTGMSSTRRALLGRLRMIRAHRARYGIGRQVSVVLFVILSALALTSNGQVSDDDASLLPGNAATVIDNLADAGITNSPSLFAAIKEARNTGVPAQYEKLRNLGIDLNDGEFSGFMEMLGNLNEGEQLGMAMTTINGNVNIKYVKQTTPTPESVLAGPISDVGWLSEVIKNWGAIHPVEALTWLYATRNAYGYDLNDENGPITASTLGSLLRSVSMLDPGALYGADEDPAMSWIDAMENPRLQQEALLVIARRYVSTASFDRIRDEIAPRITDSDLKSRLDQLLTGQNIDNAQGLNELKTGLPLLVSLQDRDINTLTDDLLDINATRQDPVSPDKYNWSNYQSTLKRTMLFLAAERLRTQGSEDGTNYEPEIADMRAQTQQQLLNRFNGAWPADIDATIAYVRNEIATNDQN